MMHITYPIPSKRALFTAKGRQPCVLFDNVFKGNLASPTQGAVGFPQINATDGKTNTAWIPSGAAPATFATVTTLPLQKFDSIGITAHTLGTVNATFVVQCFIGGSWTSVSDPISPVNDKSLLVIFPEVEAVGIRLQITAYDAPPVLGVISGGLRFVFKPCLTLPYSPLHLSEDIDMLTNQSGNGNFLGNRVRRRGLTGSIGLSITDYSWVLEYMEPFRRYYNDGGAFFFAASPVDLMQDLVYCWREGATLRPQFVSGRHYVRFTMEIRGYAG